MKTKEIYVELISVADYAMVSEDKKLSVIGIFDKLFTNKVPAAHPRMSFVVIVCGEPSNADNLKVKIMSPSGKELFDTTASVTFGENGKANLVSNFAGFLFPEVGTYKFILQKDQKELAVYLLDVIRLKEPDGRRISN